MNSLTQNSRSTARRAWRVHVARPHGPFPLRGELEELIRTRYALAYGAEVHHFHPLLLGLTDGNGRLVGAIGANPAQPGAAFFLDIYLDDPIEVAIGRQVAAPVDRNSICEVGNLAGCVAGSGPALITALAAYLRACGCEWVVFTATMELRDSLEKLAIALIDLGEADADRLGDARIDWGTYYDTHPRVTAVALPQLLAALRGSRLESRLGAVWAEARARGTEDRRVA